MGKKEENDFRLLWGKNHGKSMSTNEGKNFACDLCESDTNVFYKCLDCEENLCERCKLSHERSKATKMHKISSFVCKEVSAKPAKKTFCKDHTKQEVNLYCQTCSYLVCIDCVTSSHRKHEFTNLKEITQIKLSEVSDMLNHMSSNIVPIFRAKAKSMEKKRNDLSVHIDKTSKALSEHRKNILLQINECFNGLEQENENSRHRNNKCLLDIKSKCEEIVMLFDEALAKYTPLLSSQSAVDIIAAEKELKEQLKKIEHLQLRDNYELELYQYINPDMSQSKVKDLCGFLESDSSNSSDFESITESRIVKAEIKLKSKFQYLARENYEMLVAICPIENNCAWIHGSRLQKDHLVTTDGKLKSAMELGFLVTDLKRMKNGTMLACSYLNSNINIISEEGKILKHVSDTSPLHPYGICETSSEDILVCLVDTSDYELKPFTSRRCVMKITISGDVLGVFEYHEGKRLFTVPQKVIENIDNNVCVVNRTSPTAGNVCIFDNSMKLLSKYTGNKSLFNPMNVVCDSFGRIIITDYCNKVHLLSKDGQFLQYLLTEKDGLNHPFALALSKDQKYLWVGDCDKTVMVYDYLN